MASEVVHRPGKAATGLVDAREGVVGKERVRAPAERKVMAHVARGLFCTHRWQRIAQRHALVERGETPETQPCAQARLAQEQKSERRGAVHLRVREQAELFELASVKQMALVNDDYDPSSALGGHFGQQLACLGDGCCLEDAWLAP